MSQRVRVSKLARADLDAIWEYVVGHEGIDSATQLINSITDSFPVLGRYARFGRRRDEIEPGARSFPVGNYVIYYRQRKGGIEISHIIHGKRDQKRAWGREAET